MSDERTPRRLQTYSSDALTVTFAPERCIHAAKCVRALPQVFAPKERPWIRMQRGDDERIAEAVEMCPTGALQLSWKDGRSITPKEAASVVIRLERKGPAYVSGPARIEGEDGSVLVAEGERVALCRCGGSKNAPYCDGTHRTLASRGGSAPAGP